MLPRLAVVKLVLHSSAPPAPPGPDGCYQLLTGSLWAVHIWVDLRQARVLLSCLTWAAHMLLRGWHSKGAADSIGMLLKDTGAMSYAT
jgi:hypothetical protein